MTTWIAAKGYGMVSKVANWMAPIIVLAFLACGLVAAKQLEINSFSEFFSVWGEGSEPFPGQMKYTFWHVFLWSWFCNAAMHIGMSDLSVFRYARSSLSGWTTAAGMYVGHYIAWIAACLLYAVYLKSPEAATFLAEGTAPPVAPGPLAFNAIGWFGIIAVILAGWTTANPTIYRSGLAFQAILPKWSITQATLLAGSVATLAGIFPAFAMKLLDFVAVYGFILAPVGAVIVSNDKIIARAHNLTEMLNDVTAHAEMQAITSAANYLGGKYLHDCTLYVTLEPCQMCAGAMYWAQLSRLVFGASDPHRGYRKLNTTLHPKTKVSYGVLSNECKLLIDAFFIKKRKLKKT